uniref:Pentatricopeptide repeat-containing protein n=1 Tax=Ananas comosus var. bracteatus TaxID=296719 RepID=A0A6V7QD37_ANACO|nr:unnamed protein product [Ananas comosus var. bracteatus]
MLGTKFPFLPALVRPNHHRARVPLAAPDDSDPSRTPEPDLEPDRPVRVSPKLSRWSRARSIRSGRTRLDWPALRKRTARPSPLPPPPPHQRDLHGLGRHRVTAEHSVNAALGQFEHCLIDRGCPVNTHLFSGYFQRPIASSEFRVLLQSCTDARSFDQAKKIHFRIREAGFEKNRDLLPKLVKLYSVCGRIDVARQLFDKMRKSNLDVFVWTAMICAYVGNGSPIEGVKLFVEMLADGVRPDSYTFSALLKASADLDVDCAQKVFDRIKHRDVVSWSSMIQACSRIENYAESISLFSAMQFEELLRPNELTIVSLLPTCGFYSSLRKGQAIHAFAIRNGFRENPIVGSALVSMYSRCGEPEIAYSIFNGLERKNIILWTSMIEGFALNGKFDMAMDLFKTMQECGIKPNYVTSVVVLSACSHGGLVDEGLEILKTMPQKFG